MIDIGNKDITEECVKFAKKFLQHLSCYDLKELSLMVDFTIEDHPVDVLAPRPDGFSYSEPESYDNWSHYFLSESAQGFDFHFEVPFKEEEFRSGYARFHMGKKLNGLVVTFEGIVPS